MYGTIISDVNKSMYFQQLFNLLHVITLLGKNISNNSPKTDLFFINFYYNKIKI
jgi:hypothetical protein